MSLLDDISKLISGDAGCSGPMAAIIGMLGSHEGGTAGLTKSFQSNGLGNVLSSWLGSGENQPISADQISRVFGNDKVAGIAAKLGLSQDEASSKIAEYLPKVIDHLSPDGKLPETGDLMAKAGGLLRGAASKST